MKMTRKITVMGIPFADLTAKDAAEEALALYDGTPQWVVTPNAIMLQAAREDPSLHALLASAPLALADGRGVSIAARREGKQPPRRLPGIEFGEALLALAAERGLRVFLLGGGDRVATRAAERLKERFPRLHVCGCFWGFFEKEGRQNDEILALINATRPDLLFVCFGFPLQERWIAENCHRIPSLRLAVGLGGSLDVWAGDVKRAPRPIRAASLEWAWRIFCRPKKLANLPILLRFLKRRGS